VERTRQGVHRMFTALVVDLAVTAFAPGLALLFASVSTSDFPTLSSFMSIGLATVVGALYLSAFMGLYAGRMERGDVAVRAMRQALGLVGVVAAIATALILLRILGLFGAGAWLAWQATTGLDVAAAAAAGTAFVLTFRGLMADRWRPVTILATGLGTASALLPGVALSVLDAAADPLGAGALFQTLIAAGWIVGAASLAMFAVVCNDAATRLTPAKE